jgi:hypothetical protein
VRIRVDPASRRVLDVAGHAEMDEEVPATLELDDQILAAPAQAADSFALELACHEVGGLGPGEPRVGDLDALEPATNEARLQASADRLDLG